MKVVDDRNVEADEAERDALLDRLLADVPSRSIRDRMLDTLARLADAGPDNTWAQVRYLNTIDVLGWNRVFPTEPADQPTLDGTRPGQPEVASIPCVCGGQTEPVPWERRRGRLFRHGTCGDCAGPLVTYAPDPAC